MMTSVECLVKAEQLDALALECVSQAGRDAYAQMAVGWRRNATMALMQEKLKPSP